METSPSEVDVLAIGAHPDDIELGCAGTLAGLRAQGRTLGGVDLTRGELGSRGTAETRDREAIAAARLMGLRFRANLGMTDGSLSVDPESRLRIVKIIRTCRPRLILTHSQTGHPDHWKAHTLVTEAAHHSGLAKIETGQQRFRPRLLAYWLQYSQNASPDVLVDVSDYYHQKEEAVRCYGSQLAGNNAEPETYLSRPDFLEQVRSHHRFLGNLGECRFAEGFLLSRLPKISDLTDC